MDSNVAINASLVKKKSFRNANAIRRIKVQVLMSDAVGKTQRS